MYTQVDVQLQTSADFIHSVSYNYYGDRLAVSSSSQRILIYDRNESNPEDWTLSDVIENAHDGPIWKIDWTPPEYGSILVSCSEDRTVAIWAEASSDFETNLASRGVTCNWKRRARLIDSQSPVTDVSFHSHSQELRFAACNSEGLVRIYEALDYHTLSSWSMEEVLHCMTASSSTPSAFNNEEKPSDRKVIGCSAIAWAKGRKLGAAIIVSGCDGTIQIWRRINGKWILTTNIQAHNGIVRDISWSFCLSREYDILASCGDDSKICLWAVRSECKKSADEIMRMETLQDDLMEPHLNIDLLRTFESGVGPMWRIIWNITGTILAASTADGVVQTWRQGGIGGNDWIAENQLSPEYGG